MSFLTREAGWLSVTVFGSSGNKRQHRISNMVHAVRGESFTGGTERGCVERREQIDGAELTSDSRHAENVCRKSDSFRKGSGGGVWSKLREKASSGASNRAGASNGRPR